MDRAPKFSDKGFPPSFLPSFLPSCIRACLGLLIMVMLTAAATGQSAVTIESVEVDVDNFCNNPWSVFDVIVDVDTLADDECATVFLTYEFFSPTNGVSVYSFEDEPFEVCGTDYHPQRKLFGHGPEGASSDDPSSQENSDDGDEEIPFDPLAGLFGCSEITITGHATADSYNTDSGLPEGSMNAHCNLYSNLNISLSGHAHVQGNAAAGDISVSGSAVLTGTQTLGQWDWDCLKAWMDEVRDTVSELNHNERFGLTSKDRSPFSPSDSLDFRLENEDLVVLSGTYYVESIAISGHSSLTIEGPVLMFCTGPVSIHGQTTINTAGSPKDLAIYSLSDSVSVSGTAQINAELFAPNGSISLTGSATVHGCAFADRLELSANSAFHFNEFAWQEKLTYVVVTTGPDDDPVRIISDPFAVVRMAQLWELDIVDGQFCTITRHYDPDGNLITDPRPFMLKGYSDYFLLSELEIFKNAITEAQGNNIWKLLLGYEYWEGPTLYQGQLNFHRTFTTYFRVNDDAIQYSLGSTVDQYCQPWKYVNTVNNKHTYDMYTPQDCASIPDISDEPYNCYWNRMDKLLTDARLLGVIVEINYFDRAMTHSYWSDNPFNRANQIAGQKNEILSIADNALSREMYWGVTRARERENLFRQQQHLVKMITEACADGDKFQSVIFVPMNEPYMYVDEWSTDLGGTRFNDAIVWHETIADWGRRFLYDVPGGYRKYFAGVNLYRSDGGIVGDYLRHQNAFEWFYYGRNDSIQYEGMDNPGRFRINSYHTPYYKLDAQTCTQRIGDLKTWHEQHFSTKACIIDTDGDMGDCRNDETNIMNWAEAAYYNYFGAKSACFISKSRWYNYIPDDEDYPLMRRIYEACEKYNPSGP